MNFFGEEKLSRLPSTNKVANENVHFQIHTNFLLKLQSSSATLFLEGSRIDLNFPSLKNLSNENSRNNKYDITITLSSQGDLLALV
jgi:hypothetical protein